MTYHDGTCTRIEITDATERTADLCHFDGCSLMSMNLERTTHRELRIDRRTAAELATVFDYFARHNQLPRTHPKVDYSI